MNIFERAARAKLRFPASNGMLLTTEQLFDLPLTHTRSINLDELARAVNRELRDIVDGSFVETKPDPRKITLELQLDLLKHVIASKQADAEAAKTRAANEAQRQRLLAALDAKGEQKLVAMSEDEIRAELAKLSA